MAAIFARRYMRCKHIIFDFDGTLGDTRHTIVETFQATMREMNLEVRGEAECVATIGLTLEQGIMTMYPTMSREQAQQCVLRYRDILYRDIDKNIPRCFEGVAATLAELHRRGVTMSIASSRSSPSLLLFMRSMGIADYFCYVLGSDNVTSHKPNPEPVNNILAKLNLSPSDAIMVGDMPVDILMGRNASVRSVGVTYGNSSREELSAAGADHVIDSIAELINIVDLQ